MNEILSPVHIRHRRRHRELPALLGCVILSVLLILLSGCATHEQRASACCERDGPSTGVGDEDGGSSNVRLDQEPATASGAPNDEFLASRWLPPSERTRLPLNHQLSRHDGEAVRLSDLVGQPLAISFAYTRCMNPNKCRAVTTTLGTLQRKLKDAGLAEQVKLVLITYDPLYDTPKVMREYAKRNQLELNEHALFLRPPTDPEHRVFRDLGVNASFNPTGVAIHGIQLLLVDKSGRLARTYRTLIWSNDEVAEDLARLAAE